MRASQISFGYCPELRRSSSNHSTIVHPWIDAGSWLNIWQPGHCPQHILKFHHPRRLVYRPRQGVLDTCLGPNLCMYLFRFLRLESLLLHKRDFLATLEEKYQLWRARQAALETQSHTLFGLLGWILGMTIIYWDILCDQRSTCSIAQWSSNYAYFFAIFFFKGNHLLMQAKFRISSTSIYGGFGISHWAFSVWFNSCKFWHLEMFQKY